MTKYIDNVEESKKRLIEVVADCTDMSNELVDYNLFLWSLSNRAMSLNRGYIALTKDNNYLCAIPLMRLQLDNCLRFNALNCVEDNHAFIMSWMNGQKISNYKDKITNKKLSDKFLAENLDGKYKNVLNLYNAACNYVHLSQENLYSTAHAKPESRVIHGEITGYDRIPDNIKNNIDRCMVYVNNILIDLVYKYAKQIGVIKY